MTDELTTLTETDADGVWEVTVFPNGVRARQLTQPTSQPVKPRGR